MIKHMSSWSPHIHITLCWITYVGYIHTHQKWRIYSLFCFVVLLKKISGNLQTINLNWVKWFELCLLFFFILLKIIWVEKVQFFIIAIDGVTIPSIAIMKNSFSVDPGFAKSTIHNFEVRNSVHQKRVQKCYAE